MKKIIALISILYYQHAISQDEINKEKITDKNNIKMSYKQSKESFESLYINSKPKFPKEINRVKAIEDIKASTFYEESVEEYLTKRKKNLNLLLDVNGLENQNIQGNTKIKSKNETKRKVAQKTKRQRSVRKKDFTLVALYNNGALINENGYKRSVKVGDVVNDWTVIEITNNFLKAVNIQNKTNVFTVK